jgi:hypothetical protein
MKKILFMAICLLVAGSVKAQTYYYSPPQRHYVRHQARRPQYDDFYRIKVGLEAGLNVANTVDAYNSNYSTGTIAGLNAGVTLEVPLIYPLSFEPEVLFSQKGFTSNDASINDGGGNFTSRSNFIDVPLLAKFRLAPGFNFLIGPQISFLLNTTNSYPATYTQDHYNYNGNTTFLDGVIGFSVDINPLVDIHARYTIDFNQTDAYGNTTVPAYRNQVFQIGLGFKFQ